MNAAEYARHRKVSSPTVSEWIKKGYIKGACDRVGAGYKIDHKKADKLLKKRLHQSYRQKKDPLPDEEKQEEIIKSAKFECLDFNEARTMKERYLAALRKLEYQEKTQKVVTADSVKKAAYDLGRRVRDALLGIPDRISASCAADTDVKRVHNLISTEIKNVIEGLVK